MWMKYIFYIDSFCTWLIEEYYGVKGVKGEFIACYIIYYIYIYCIVVYVWVIVIYLYVYVCIKSQRYREKWRELPPGQGVYQFVPTMLKSPTELERNSCEWETRVVLSIYTATLKLSFARLAISKYNIHTIHNSIF